MTKLRRGDLNPRDTAHETVLASRLQSTPQFCRLRLSVRRHTAASMPGSGERQAASIQSRRDESNVPGPAYQTGAWPLGYVWMSAFSGQLSAVSEQQVNADG